MNHSLVKIIYLLMSLWIRNDRTAESWISPSSFFDTIIGPSGLHVDLQQNLLVSIYGNDLFHLPLDWIISNSTDDTHRVRLPVVVYGDYDRPKERRTPPPYHWCPEWPVPLVPKAPWYLTYENNCDKLTRKYPDDVSIACVPDDGEVTHAALLAPEAGAALVDSPQRCGEDPAALVEDGGVLLDQCVAIIVPPPLRSVLRPTLTFSSWEPPQ